MNGVLLNVVVENLKRPKLTTKWPDDLCPDTNCEVSPSKLDTTPTINTIPLWERCTAYRSLRPQPGVHDERQPALSIQATAIRLVCDSLTTTGDKTMRFMIIVKASPDSEAGVMPSKELMTAMGNYNEELTKAGILIDCDGLQPSSKGARVRFSGDQRTVIDGPFAETKELIAGYWLWEVKSKEEAIEWVKRCPNPMPGTEAEIEIRPVYSAEDFGSEFTPELREQEERIRAQAKKS